MALIKFEPAPAREPIATDDRGRTFSLFYGWLPWFTKLFDIIDSLLPSVSQDIGDNDVTLTVGTSEKTQVYDSPITADRAVTLSTTKAYNGAAFHIVRTANATGASTVDVGGLTTLAVGEWCDVKMSDTAWLLARKGSL